MARYNIEACGDCLGEWLPNGTTMVADTEAGIRPYDLVSIAIRDSDGPWGRWIRSTGEESVVACKMFLGRLEGENGYAVMVGQLNPPVVSLIPEAEIEALHKVVAVTGRDGPAKLTENDRAAFNLIAPFGMRKPMQPIAPDWRPPSAAQQAAA